MPHFQPSARGGPRGHTVRPPPLLLMETGRLEERAFKWRKLPPSYRSRSKQRREVEPADLEGGARPSRAGVANGRQPCRRGRRLRP
jgi:hypothetical protein